MSFLSMRLRRTQSSPDLKSIMETVRDAAASLQAGNNDEKAVLTALNKLLGTAQMSLIMSDAPRELLHFLQHEETLVALLSTAASGADPRLRENAASLLAMEEADLLRCLLCSQRVFDSFIGLAGSNLVSFHQAFSLLLHSHFADIMRAILLWDPAHRLLDVLLAQLSQFYVADIFERCAFLYVSHAQDAPRAAAASPGAASDDSGGVGLSLDEEDSEGEEPGPAAPAADPPEAIPALRCVWMDTDTLGGRLVRVIGLDGDPTKTEHAAEVLRSFLNELRSDTPVLKSLLQRESLETLAAPLRAALAGLSGPPSAAPGAGRAAGDGAPAPEAFLGVARRASVAASMFVELARAVACRDVGGEEESGALERVLLELLPGVVEALGSVGDGEAARSPWRRDVRFGKMRRMQDGSMTFCLSILGCRLVALIDACVALHRPLLDAALKARGALRCCDRLLVLCRHSTAAHALVADVFRCVLLFPEGREDLVADVFEHCSLRESVEGLFLGGKKTCYDGHIKSLAVSLLKSERHPAVAPHLGEWWDAVGPGVRKEHHRLERRPMSCEEPPPALQRRDSIEVYQLSGAAELPEGAGSPAPSPTTVAETPGPELLRSHSSYFW